MPKTPSSKGASKSTKNDTIRVVSKPVAVYGKLPSSQSVRDRVGDFPTNPKDASLLRKTYLAEKKRKY